MLTFNIFSDSTRNTLRPIKKTISGVLALSLVIGFVPVNRAEAVDDGLTRSFDAYSHDVPSFQGAKGLEADLSTGGFVYEYPVSLPPGRASMTPALNLTYSSNDKSNESYFGYGWSVDIPYIVRENRHGSDALYEYDDFISSTAGELVKISTTTYYAEVEAGAYSSYEYSNNTWTVYDQEGTRYLYGSATSSRQYNASSTDEIYKWFLEEVRDTNDNYIKYEYFHDAGQVYPDTITYTGHGSTDGIFEVTFDRTSENITKEMYYADFPVETNYKIGSITVKENGSWVHKYELSHIYGHNGSRLLLDSVIEKGRDSETGNIIVRPASTFTYQQGGVGWQQTAGTDWESPISFYNSSSGYSPHVEVVDVNGDAYPDVVYSAEGEGPPECGNDEKTVWLNDADGTWTKYDCTDSYWDPPIFLKLTSYTFTDGGARIFDYDGDYLNDFVHSALSATTSSASSTFSGVERNAGSATNTWATTSVSVPVGFVYDNTKHSDNATQVADVNGDGLADIVYGWLDDDGSGLQENTFINDGNSWEEATSTEWELPWAFVDENQDGEEVFTFAQMVDLNGDGLSDYAFRHENTDVGEFGVIIGINNGHGWATSTEWISLPRYTELYNYLTSGKTDNGARFFDANGDGLTDFARSVGAVDEVFLGTNHGFGSNVTATIPSEFANTSIESNPEIKMADVNADGAVDILVASDSSTATYLATSTPFTDMLTGINTAEGASTTIEYKLSSQYFSGGTLLNPDLPIGMVTVESITTDDGLGNEISDTYSYQEGSFYYNTAFDRKFAGFGLVTKTDAAGNVTKSYFHQGNTSSTTIGEFEDHIDKAGRPYRIEKYDGSNNLYSKTVNKWDRYDRGNGASFIKLVQSVEFSYDGDSDHKERAVSYTYNDSTGLTVSTNEWGEVSGSDNGTFTDSGVDNFLSSFTYATSTATSTPSYYKLSQETVTNASSTKVREQKIYYDSLSFGSLNDGNPTKVEQWVTGSTYIDTERTYNSYGLVTEEKDPLDNATTFVYDSFNLFPATTTNALGQSTTYTYDYSVGKVELTTDPNGNQFKTLYDPLGRISEILQMEISSTSEPVAFNSNHGDSLLAYEDHGSYEPHAILDTLGEAVRSIFINVAHAEELKPSLDEVLRGKDSKGKAKLKSQTIAEQNFSGRHDLGDKTVEIVSVEPIEGGVQVFVKAWGKNGHQIGFGVDGTVDVERFRVFNPPVLVPDESGEIVREWTDRADGNLIQHKLREDPKAALLQVINKALSVMNNTHGDGKIVPGKVGRTTDIYYSEAEPASTAGDGSISYSPGETDPWDTVHDSTSEPAYSNGSALSAQADKYWNNTYGIGRAYLNFDTSSIGGNAEVSSATLTITLSGNGIDQSYHQRDVALVEFKGSAPNAVADDYDQVGDSVDNPTEGSDRIQLRMPEQAGTNYDFLFNANGLSWINKTGITKLGLRSADDVDDTAPTSDGQGRSQFYEADQTGSVDDPALVIEHSTLSAGGTGALVTKTKFTYFDNEFPRKVKKIDYLNAATSTESYTYHDGFGRKVEERTESEGINTFSVRDYYYNNRGLLARESLPFFASSTAYSATSSPPTAYLMSHYQYDALGRIKTIANAVGTTTHAYDDWSTTVTDALGNAKTLTNDAHGNLKSVIENNGGSQYTTTYEYDGNKKLTKITDADGNIRNFTYDGLGRRLTAQDLHGSSDSTYGTWTYAYDSAGNLATTTDPKSQTIVRTFDSLNRVLTEDYTGASGTEIQYGYDSCTGGIGRLCAATTTDSVTNFTYNSIGLLKSEKKTISGNSYGTGHAYDRLGNQTSITYPDDSEVAYQFNGAGKLERVRQKEDGGSFADVISAFDYGPNGAPTSKAFGNGATTTMTYDAAELYRLRRVETSATGTEAFTGNWSSYLRYFMPMLIYASTTAPEVGIEELAEPAALPEMAKSDVLGETSTSSTSVETTPNPDASVGAEPSPEETATTTESIVPDNATSTEPTSSLNEENVGVTPEAVPEVDGASTTTASSTEETVELSAAPSEESPIEIVASTTIATTTPLKLTSILPVLAGKSAKERATVKGGEMVRVTEKRVHERGSGLQIEITDIEMIEGGVQVFARAWENGKQIGFGPDGTVDIERFVIINPPILVPDSSGNIERVYKDEVTGEVVKSYYREDAREALLKILSHVIDIKHEKFGPENIIPGKVGNTTLTAYPLAGTGTAPMDAYTGRNLADDFEESFSTLRSGAGTTVTGTSNLLIVRLGAGSPPNTWKNLDRGGLGFDTSSIGTDSISSATLTITQQGRTTELGQVNIDVVGFTPSDEDNLAAADHSNFGASRYATGIISNGDFGAGYSLNATGTASIDKTGNSYFGLRTAWDVDNSSPSWSSLGITSIRFYSADEIGTTNDPELVVEHSQYSGGGGSGYIQHSYYEYDALGNITKLIDSSNSARAATTTYTYDSLYRLLSASTTEATSTPYRYQFSYNALGNILGWHDGSATSTYTYNDDGYNNPHAADSINSVNLAYDNNGNLTSYASSTYSWDYKNRLATSTSGTATTTYGYDHNNQRVLKTIGATTTVFANKLYNTNGTSTVKHIYANDDLVATVETVNGSTTIKYIHVDHLGGTEAVTDADGEIVENVSYYPFGAQRINTGSFTEQRKFTGHEYDTESDLTYANARYYDQEVGKFISQDPASRDNPAQFLLDPQQFNYYSYARNNPLIRFDPDGRKSVSRAASQTQREINKEANQLMGQLRQSVTKLYNTVANLSPAGDVRVLTTGTYFGGAQASGLDKVFAAGGLLSGGVGKITGQVVKNSARVLINKSVGDAFRDKVADELKEHGKEISTEVVKQTPFGKRVIDIEVRDESGNILGGVETKTGNSRYLPSQRAKDAYLSTQGYIVNLIRDNF